MIIYFKRAHLAGPAFVVTIEEKIMSSIKENIKDKIDKGAEKAKDATEKAADKSKGAAHKAGEKLKVAGEKVKHSAD